MIEVSGTFSGLGNPDYFLNISRKSAFWPQLIARESSYTPSECPICVIEYDGFSPNKIIDMKSRENDLYQNSIDATKIETLIPQSDGMYPVLNYPYHPIYNNKLKYLVTDYDNLFFQYELLFDSYTEFSGVGIKNIYKNNEDIVDKKSYKIQYSYDLLENNDRYSDTTWTSNVNKTRQVHRIRVLLPYEFYSEENFYTIDYDKNYNSLYSYQKELIELRPIYTSGDYTLTATGLAIPAGSKINNNGSKLKIVKDSNYRIMPLDIVTLKNQNLYMSDKDAQWKLRLNLGSFFIDSGVYTGASGKLYNLEQCYYNQASIPLTNIKPVKIKDTIIQVKEHPFFVNETKYSYPNYIVEVYDKTDPNLSDTAGKISIDINGKTREDIKIKSIDRNKGYLELSAPLELTDEVELSFYTSNSGFLYVELLELNPKIPYDPVYSAPFHIRNYPNGFGIAVLPYSGNITYPYIYDLTMKDAVNCASGMIGIGETISRSWTDDFFTICEIDLNNLTPDMVRKTDCRKIGGGVQNNYNLVSWFNENFSGVYSNEKKWYSDVGRYDGEALSGSSFIIIHIPYDIIEAEKQKWIDYFKTYTTVEESEVIARREFNHYLDQTIRKYISAGSDYVIMPVISGVITGSILNLDN